MNKLDDLFAKKTGSVLNVYCTAGYPALESTIQVMLALQESGADIIEVGMPYSDPIADGPTIQESNMQALQNGMTIELLFQQLITARDKVHIPLVLMGYLNPVMQFGIEKFCAKAQEAGVSALILPDLPLPEFEKKYKKLFAQHGLHAIFLVTPQTTKERIVLADKLSGGFLYAVSSSSTTGGTAGIEAQQPYFEKLLAMRLKNPVLIGFGIKDKESFDYACRFANGAIIGSAYIKALSNTTDIEGTTATFVHSVLGADK